MGVLRMQVIEVGQVGALGSAQLRTLYAHTQEGAAYGNASDIIAALSAATQQEAASAQVGLFKGCAQSALPRATLTSTCMFTFHHI